MNYSVAKFINLFALVIILSSGVGAQNRPDDSTEEPTKTGAIKGRVVNESGQPLANASVSVRAYGSIGGQSRMTTTDSDGNFQIGELDPLGYIVSAAAPSYTSPPRDPNNLQPTYYRVGDSVRLQLIKGGVITGMVTTQTGAPIVAVRVRAEMIRDSNGQPARYMPLFSERTTDDRGVYRIYGLAPGTYVVSAGGVGSSTFISTAYDTDAPTYAPSSTRSDAAQISVGAGQEITSVDIRYRGEPGHAVSGTVIGPGGFSPGSAFSINLSSVQQALMQSSYSVFQPPGNSGFAIYGVADGEYDVTAQFFLSPGEWTISDSKRIKVKGADVTGLELVMKTLGSIKGRVVLEQSKTPECKDKLRPSFAEMLVTAWHNEREARERPPFIFSYGSPVVPDKQGDFTLRNLAAGEYRFAVRFFAKYWYLQSITLQSSSNAASNPSKPSSDKAAIWTPVKWGDRMSGLSITLAEGAASFRGSVQLTQGDTIPGKIYVHLIPAEKEKAEDVLRFFSVAVDAERKFVLSNVSPGRYLAFASVVADNESTAMAKIRFPDEVEARAKLRLQAQAAKTEIELKPCQNLIDYQLLLKEPAR